MKLFRFHLSTLLLASIFAGALIGLYLAPPPWQHRFSLPIDNRHTPLAHRFALGFDAAASHLFVCHNDDAYLFDLASKRALWKRVFYTQSFGDASVRFSADNNVIELGFPEDENAAEMRIGGVRFLSVADGTDMDRPSGDAPWLSDYYTAMVPIEGRSVFTRGVWMQQAAGSREVRIARGISPDRREVCDRPFIYSLQNHAFSAALDSLRSSHPLFTMADKQPHAAEYSPDGNWLAVSDNSGVSIWRRTRAYGWKGYLELPLFWVAAASLLCLLVLFVRWVGRAMRKSA